jgi:hypothetical protein
MFKIYDSKKKLDFLSIQVGAICHPPHPALRIAPSSVSDGIYSGSYN